MKFSNILIVTDLDGTFFNEKRQLVQKNLDAIAYFQENGGMFTFAPGREPNVLGFMAPIAPKLCNAPSVLCNGSYSYDFEKGERIGEIELNYEKTVELVHFCIREFPQIGIRISTHEGYYSPNDTEFIHKTLGGFYTELVASNQYHVCDIDKTPHCGWTRCAFNAESDDLDALRPHLEERFGEYFAFNKAEAHIFEYQDKRATKGQGIDTLRRQLIEAKKADESLKIYALGDYDNDRDLLLHADVACCPANAIDSIKAIASVHLCHCNDGTTADLIARIERGLA